MGPALEQRLPLLRLILQTAAGVAATAFPGSYNYYNLYINGLMQTADTSSATTTTITIPGGDALNAGTPIVVQFVVS